MGSGFSKMKKQARQMQEQYSQMREDQQKKRVTGTSGNGLVTVTLDGDRNLCSLNIKPDCVDKDDIEGLQDLILAAFEEAAKQLDDESNDLSSMMPNMPFGF